MQTQRLAIFLGVIALVTVVSGLAGGWAAALFWGGVAAAGLIAGLGLSSRGPEDSGPTGR